jgi:hypothetical protein
MKFSAFFCFLRLPSLKDSTHSSSSWARLRRMNVVLTRARAAVIIVGDRDILTKGTAGVESTKVWKTLLD